MIRWATVRRELRRHPVTIALTILIAGVGIVALTTGSRGPFTLDTLGLDTTGIRARHWWLLFTSLIPASGVLQLVIAVLACLFGLGVAERFMGSRRTVVAFLVTGVLASGLGVGLQLLGQDLGEFWSTSVHEFDTVDPLTPIGGALAWSSAWAGPLWRRRIRTLLIAVAASLLLYSGQPADLYLLVAVLLGTLIGARLRPAPRTAASARELRALFALAAVVLAIGPIFTIVSGTRYGILSPLGVALVGAAPTGGNACHAAAVGSGCVAGLTQHRLTAPSGLLVAIMPLVLQLVGARALAVGRHAAVLVVAGISILNSAAAAWYLGVAPVAGAPRSRGVSPGHEWEFALWLLVSTVIPLGFAAILLVFRRAFPVRAPHRRAMVALVVAVAGVVVPASVYLIVGSVAPGGFRPQPGVRSLLASLADRLTPAPLLRHILPALVPDAPLTRIVSELVGPVTWITLVVAAIIVCGGRRSAAAQSEATGVSALLAQRSGELGYMATWPGVRLWTAPGGGGVAYRLVDGCAITVSDPLGLPADPDLLIDGFLRFCDGHAWTPVFYSVHDEWEQRLRRRGWSSLVVAEEAVIDPTTFQLSGKAMQDVRTSRNRAERLGIRAEWHPGDAIPHRLLTQLHALSEEWLADRDLPELGFTLGGLDEMLDAAVDVGVAVDAEGRVLAVTSWLPVTESGRLVGRTLDVMRRRGDAPNGVMEFLIADGIARMNAQGLVIASLSGSPLARSDTAGGVLGRILDSLGGAIEPVYGFRSLQRFKLKFRPATRSLHLVVRDPLALPAIGLAIGRAYLPGLGMREARAVLAAR